MKEAQPSLTELLVKACITHTVTYFMMGLLASTLLDYEHWFAESRLNQFMRPTTDPLVMAGPLFQPLRGLLFGLVFFVLREPFFNRRRGWLVMWLVLLVLGILSTFGPTPGSVEGMVYMTLPITDHLRGLPEVVLQSLLLSLILFHWVNHRDKRWPSWVMGLAFFTVLALPALGLLAGQLGRHE